MKTKTAISLLVGVLLLLIGAALFLIPLANNGWDFSKLSGNRYQTKSYDITEDFTKISVDLQSADIRILPATDGGAKVISYERSKEINEVKVEDGVLSITLIDTSKWYDHISFFNFGKPAATVYLPKAEYEALSISLTTGDIRVDRTFTFGTIRIDGTTGDIEEMANATDTLGIHLTTGDIQFGNIRAGVIAVENTTGDMEIRQIECTGALTLKTGTGDIDLSDINAASLSIKATTGELELDRVTLKDALTIRSTTGDVSFHTLDAGSIDIHLSTGEVSGSVTKPMMFSAESTTGKVRIPMPEAGGACRIETTTGDITVTVKP